MFTRSSALLAAAALLGLGCTNAMEDINGFNPSATGKPNAQKPEVWSAADAPSLFSASLNYKLAELPAQGEAARIPWAGSYWPVYQDGLNHKWDGANDAPSTKYAKAFAGTGVEDAVSRANGIDSQAHRTKCTAADAATKCKTDLGEECSFRAGKTEGYCIPTWFGICHAWAPAAIMAVEPQKEVTRNGVTFKINDLKALSSLVHEGVETKFVSLRCESDDRVGADEAKDVDFDADGRPTQRECRDSNAGSFHVLVANFLGVQRAAFVFDRTYDDEVWNQPLRGYKVVDTRTVDFNEAHRLIGVGPVGGTSQTLTATLAKDAWQHFPAVAVVAGQPLKVAMSGTGDADLFVKFGAQPTADAYECRPYADGSDETCELTPPAGATQAFISVNGYTAATVSVVVSSGGTARTAYAFNAKATKLQYVKLDISYIGESSSETDGNLGATIDRYTSTDRYEYILEVDVDGKIIGGEWIGASKRFHPDFAWLPVAVRNASVAGGKISYANVKSLLDESITPATPGTPGTAKTETKTGTLAKDAWAQFGPYNVAAGSNLVVNMTGTGDADLYVKKGSAPTTATYDCRPYKDGSTESCSVPGGAQVFISVNGYATTSNFSLAISWTEPGASTGGGGTVTPPPPPPNVTAHLNVTGNVALGAYSYHTVNVIAGKPITIRTVAGKDVDVYLQMGSSPTEANALAQAFTSSGNETLKFVPSSSGVLHIGVHGYEASAFTLTTADN
ncbi:MAG: pre-peptidase C-terminal domain-containing protein [Deltaproteobacteria bacterium]|nr:pre-peptidase C-terminal domain-containing protein [Deltaproteobacteria bacterium]